MSHQNHPINQKLDDALARAKALRFAAAHGAISYERAKVKTEALLQIVNKAGEKIAKKYRRRYRHIRFTDL